MDNTPQLSIAAQESPTDRTQPSGVTPAPNATNIEAQAVTNLDFATEIRIDRLAIIWRVILGVSLFFIWVGILRRGSDGAAMILGAITLAAGAFIAGQLLKRHLLAAAVWSIALSGIIAICIPLATGNQDAINIAPFFFPLLILLVGLLLPPRHAVVVFITGFILTFLVPFVTTSDIAFISIYQLVALSVSLVSVLLAAQVTGDLYQITGWALDNYQRERRTAIDLFENRQRLEKALQRSRVLSDKLQDINAELENAKHFRGQFLANMSHELRTPLNAIIGFSETMLNFPMMYGDVELAEAYRHDMEQINQSGQQLLTVINDILDLSKVDAGKLDVHIERVPLDPLIDGVMMTAAGLIARQNKPVDLKRDTPVRLPDVYADDARLRQVLLNLYSNAIKFTEVGSITIAVRELGDDEICISVSDTGAGVQDDALEVIFEEFSQVEGSGRDPRAGAGLGLTISRRLLNLMNGRIWAESVYGEGATFHVVVPKYIPEQHKKE